MYEKNDELMHYGRKGMKWGQNIFGKEYKKALRADKRFRSDLELEAYDSAKFANKYSKKLKTYSKKYEKALAKDPTKSNLKTLRLENTKKSIG